MPIYEFICKKCEYTFEELLSIHEKWPKCPKCNSNLDKLLSDFCGIVKGSEHRSIDCIVGEDSEKKWEGMHKRKENRKKKAMEKKNG